MIKSVEEYIEKNEIVIDYFNNINCNQIDNECPELLEVRDWNRALCNAYPFIRYRDWTSPNNEIIDNYYDTTMLDDMPIGWYIAFGLDMCEEINNALARANIDPRDYVVEQVKEKFGGLRWYDSNGCKEVDDIIDKYEQISYNTCCWCGKPAVWETTGWICPYCDDCAHELFNSKYKLYHCDDSTTFENCGYFKPINAGGDTHVDEE